MHLLLLLLFPSCATYIEPDASEHVRYIEKLIGTSVTTSIYFAPIEGHAVGVCYFLPRKIEIDIHSWPNFSKKQQLALITHEIGHCDFSLDHDDRLLEDGCPFSIMNYQLLSNDCLEAHWEGYKSEFINKTVGRK